MAAMHGKHATTPMVPGRVLQYFEGASVGPGVGNLPRG
jgi:hypothetical protein